MCGIVGVVGKAEVAPLLLEALRRLEYRGYDSAGIATLVNGCIEHLPYKPNASCQTGRRSNT